MRDSSRLPVTSRRVFIFCVWKMRRMRLRWSILQIEVRSITATHLSICHQMEPRIASKMADAFRRLRSRRFFFDAPSLAGTRFTSTIRCDLARFGVIELNASSRSPLKDVPGFPRSLGRKLSEAMRLQPAHKIYQFIHKMDTRVGSKMARSPVSPLRLQHSFYSNLLSRVRLRCIFGEVLVKAKIPPNRFKRRVMRDT